MAEGIDVELTEELKKLIGDQTNVLYPLAFHGEQLELALNTVRAFGKAREIGLHHELLLLWKYEISLGMDDEDYTPREPEEIVDVLAGYRYFFVTDDEETET